MMRSHDQMNREDYPDPRPLPRPAILRCARRSFWFGSIRRTECHYSFIGRIRNVRRRGYTKCSTTISTCVAQSLFLLLLMFVCRAMAVTNADVFILVPARHE